MRATTSQLPRVIGYVTVAAMLPYLALKTAWLLGDDLGVAEPGLMRTTPFVVGNLLTAGMELAGAGLALALVHRWGRRVPAWLLLLPMWVASGLLAPVMLAAPLGFVAESLTGAGGTGGPGAADGPVSGLQGWVYAVVYTGFLLQGTGLAIAFVLHLRARWRRVLTASLDDRAGAVSGVQRAVTAVVGCLTALVVANRLYRAASGGGIPERALDASTAGLALVGGLGLVAMVSRRPAALRLWIPLAALWVGAGSMVWSGTYQLVLLLAPGTPFETSDGTALGLLLAAQTAAGLLAAATGASLAATARSPFAADARSIKLS